MRSRLVRLVLLGLLVALLGVPTLGTGPGDAAHATSPSAATSSAVTGKGKPLNVVVIMADDMRADDLRYLWRTRKAVTMHGIRFTRAHSANPLCCPARASLLAGQYSHNTGVYGNDKGSYGGWRPFVRHNPRRQWLPRLIKRGRPAYNLSWIGKTLHGIPKGRFSMDRSWDHQAIPTGGIYNYWKNSFSINGKAPRTRTGVYRERYTRRILMRQIDRRAHARKHPFVIMYNSLAPHVQLAGKGRSRQPQAAPAFRSSPVQVPRPGAGYREGNGPGRAKRMSDKPLTIRRSAKPMDEQQRRDAWTARVRSLRSVDVTVRAAVKRLKRHGLWRNTVFVVTSDNGFLIGEHGQRQKNRAFQEATRIPLVVSGPGFSDHGAKRMVTRSLDVSLVDLSTTILRAARVPRPAYYDGVALQDVVRHPGRFARRVIPIEGSTQMFSGPKGRPSTALPTQRDGRYWWGAVHRYWTFARYAGGATEFYDRRPGHDRAELHSLGKKSDNRYRKRLAKWVRQHNRCRGWRACNEPFPNS